MVSAQSTVDSKYFTVAVTSPDADEAKVVAEKVIEAFCEGVSKDDLLAKGGAEGKVVDRPEKGALISPNKTLNTLVGAVVGALLSCIAIIIAHFASNRLQSEEWLIANFGDSIPLLAVIPDASSTEYRYDHKYYSSKKNN